MHLCIKNFKIRTNALKNFKKYAKIYSYLKYMHLFCLQIVNGYLIYKN